MRDLPPYSRGAIAVAVLGLVTLVALAPTRAQLRAAAVAADGRRARRPLARRRTPWPPSRGRSDDRRADRARGSGGDLASGAGHRPPRGARGPTARRRSQLPRGARPRAPPPQWWRWPVGLAVGGLAEKPSRRSWRRRQGGAPHPVARTATSTGAWRLGAFGRQPLGGVGAGGFRVEWLRERSIPEVVRDTHSLEVELAAELGLVGLLDFALMIAGVAGAARRALRRHPREAAGSCAALIAWILHASIDWDWQLPAVTLPADRVGRGADRARPPDARRAGETPSRG